MQIMEQPIILSDGNVVPPISLKAHLNDSFHSTGGCFGVYPVHSRVLLLEREGDIVIFSETPCTQRGGKKDWNTPKQGENHFMKNTWCESEEIELYSLLNLETNS
ncbi:hypothetical protein KIN20_010176 [Parelaphostrongylus tenuis]|uniref:Uncharacterized protein n=1 Tax=Parelaphostrongylus tenuis TaxID=148309 RepID=A0AAD5QIN6_PARTN|nr:hypothetical protein KIN20_010176 [Parelaphostrongylus tenuis]